MSKFDDQYIDLCRRILDHGEKITNYKKSDSRSATTATAIPDHAAQGSSEARTIRLPHQILQFDLEEEFSVETALVVCEIYKKNGEWKFNAVAAGYRGGLEALCNAYGVNV